MDELAQSNLHEKLGILPRTLYPRMQLPQAPSSLWLQGVRGLGLTVELSSINPVGSSPAPSCPGPGMASPRMAEENLVFSVTEEAVFELRFKDFFMRSHQHRTGISEATGVQDLPHRPFSLCFFQPW